MCALNQCGAVPGREKAFHEVPKHHLFDHIIRDLQIDKVNPTAFHCFVSESMVGKAIGTSATCHPSTMPKVHMQRYKLFLHEAWRKLGSSN